jgi:RNA polymerase sigma-70 factor (ECF subfamily)
VQGGDTAAFEILFARYSPRLFRQAVQLLGNEAEAEEILQEVFLTLYTKAQTFRAEAAVSTWLYRLTTNASLDRLRRRVRRQEVQIDDYIPQFTDDGHHRERPIVDWSQNLEGALVRDEAHQLLRQAIETLPPLDKAVVVLSDLDELSQRETADILNLTVSAVKSRLHRARLFLRGRLASVLEMASE